MSNDPFTLYVGGCLVFGGVAYIVWAVRRLQKITGGEAGVKFTRARHGEYGAEVEEFVPASELDRVRGELAEALKAAFAARNASELLTQAEEREAALEREIAEAERRVEELERAVGAKPGEPVMPLSKFCGAFRQWGQALVARRVDDEAERGSPRGDMLDRVAEVVPQIPMAVSKSSMLGRLLYEDEKLRTEKCPEHKGIWSGLPFGPTECGCDLTGWLPAGNRAPATDQPSGPDDAMQVSKDHSASPVSEGVQAVSDLCDAARGCWCDRNGVGIDDECCHPSGDCVPYHPADPAYLSDDGEVRWRDESAPTSPDLSRLREVEGAARELLGKSPLSTLRGQTARLRAALNVGGERG